MRDVTKIEAPEHTGSREQARSLLVELPQDLTGRTIVLGCSRVTVSTSSFLDELVKMLLVDHHAARLELVDATQRTEDHLLRAAKNRDVSDRVHGRLAGLTPLCREPARGDHRRKLRVVLGVRASPRLCCGRLHCRRGRGVDFESVRGTPQSAALRSAVSSFSTSRRACDPCRARCDGCPLTRVGS